MDQDQAPDGIVEAEEGEVVASYDVKVTVRATKGDEEQRSPLTNAQLEELVKMVYEQTTALPTRVTSTRTDR